MSKERRSTAALGIFLIVFLASCSKFTNTLIAKRHYRPGYYIAGNSEHKQPAERQPVNPWSRWIKHEHKDVSTSVSASNAAKAEVAVNNEDPNKIKKKEPQKKIKPSILPKPSEEYYVLPSKGKELGKTRNPYEIRNAKPMVRSEDALSLIWVLIVIILIVWLVGFLLGGFGLGNLINLLLVIALILLVLWLLRII